MISSTFQRLPRAVTASPAVNPGFRTPAVGQGACRARLTHLENCYRGAKVRVRGVEKFDHEGVLVEHFLHDASLDADAAAVNQAHLTQARGVGGADVLVDN
jgi:hypothetical protein